MAFLSGMFAYKYKIKVKFQFDLDNVLKKITKRTQTPNK